MFDSRRIAVNLGETDGVQVGDRVEIYTPPSEVVDPDTGATLGSYRRRKAVLIAREVFPSFSVAYPPDRQVPVDDSSQVQGTGVFGGLFAGPRYRTVPGEAPIEPDQVDPLPTGGRIQVGDTVEVVSKVEKQADTKSIGSAERDKADGN
jgi:hypothetical protein